MICAKLYPDALVDGYRTAMRGLYADVYDTDALRNLTPEGRAAFAASHSLHDREPASAPAGEHCIRGLVCPGCHHAQPKNSAAPVFRRMIGSHTRALTKAKEYGEPAGQIAALERELDVLT